MPQTKITGITDWLKRKGRKIGSFIDNRAASIGREMVGISTKKPKTSTTSQKTTTGEGYRAKAMTGLRSIWATSMASSQAVSRYILYTLTLFTACLIFTFLITIHLSYWVLISVGHQLVRFYNVIRSVAGFASTNSA